MASANDIISTGLQKLGIYAPGEPLTSADQQAGLTVLNDMLDQWAATFVYIFQLVPLTVAVSTGISSYGINSRPPRILYGPAAATFTLTLGGGVSTVAVVSAVEWNALYANEGGLGGTPTVAFYDPQTPNGVVNVAPMPNAPGTLALSAFQAFPAFAALGTEYTFSPGTDEALRSNFCVAAKPFWTAAQLDPAIVTTAAEAKRGLALANLNSRAAPGRLRKAMQAQQPRPAA